MRFSRTIFILAGVLFCLPVFSAAESFLPVGSREYEFIYDAIRRHEIQSGFEQYNFNIAPYNPANARINYSPPHFADTVGPEKIKAFAFLSEDFKSARYSNEKGYESIRGGITGSPLARFSFYMNFLVDERLAEDPNYTGKKWHGLGGELENAVISYSDKRFDFLFGRFAAFWGPVDQSLVLSSDAAAMDAFSFRFRWGKLNFTYQAAKLNSLNKMMDSASYFENRYFSGHRIDFRILHNLNIGLFETIIFGGKGRNLELPYLNPLMFYHSAQLNDGVDDNTFLGFDICYYLKNRHKFYAQLLLDDYQIENNSPDDNEPNEIGYLVGLHSVNLFNFVDVKIEYLRIANRTYNQVLPRNRYENRGRLIGNAFGPDGDRLSLSVARWFESDKRAALNFAYQRKGQGKYNDTWDDPWNDIQGEYSEPFPTGIVEKRLTTSFQLTGFYRSMVFLDITPGFEFVRNYAHTESDNRTIPFISMRLSLILSGLLHII